MHNMVSVQLMYCFAIYIYYYTIVTSFKKQDFSQQQEKESSHLTNLQLYMQEPILPPRTIK